MRHLLPMIVLGLSIGCGPTLFPSPYARLCEKAIECEETPEPDSDNREDDVAICTEQSEGLMRALRANAEPECSALADALDVYGACQSEVACESFNDPLDENCEEARSGLRGACDAISEAEIDCENILTFECRVETVDG